MRDRGLGGRSFRRALRRRPDGVALGRGLLAARRVLVPRRRLAHRTLARTARPTRPAGSSTTSTSSGSCTSTSSGTGLPRLRSGLAGRALRGRAGASYRAVARRAARRPGRAGRGRGQLALQGAPLVGVRYARGQHLAALRAAVRRTRRGLPGLLGAGPGLGDAGGEHEVLAERVALEVLGQEEVLQTRVALEVDAEHLVGLALVPGGARVDADGGGQRGGVVRDRRTDQEAADRVQGDDVRGDAEAGARFVDRAQPVEVGAGQRRTGRLQGGEPGGRRHVHGQHLVRLLGHRLRTEEFRGGGGQPAGGRAHRVPPSPAEAGGRTSPLCSAAADGRAAPLSYRSPSDSRAIFSWSLRMPWSSASGRGGHPGT